MKEEIIIRFFSLAFIHLFLEDDDFDQDDIVDFTDKKGTWQAFKLFWKFYTCIKIK